MWDRKIMGRIIQYMRWSRTGRDNIGQGKIRIV